MLTAGARAHHVLAAQADPALQVAGMEAWTHASEGALDTLGDAVGSGRWLGSVRRRKREREVVRTSTEVDGEGEGEGTDALPRAGCFVLSRFLRTDSPGAVRRPCRFHRRRCPSLRLHDPAAVLYGLDGWNGAGTLACASSPSAYPALHTALRLAVYLHLALLLEQHFLFDSAAGSPSSSWPARNRVVSPRSGSLDLTPTSTSASTSTGTSTSTNTSTSPGTPTPTRERRFSSTSPLTLAHVHSPFAHAYNLLTFSSATPTPTNENANSSSSAEAARELSSTALLRLLSAPLELGECALALSDAKETGKRLAGDERAGLRSFIGWAGGGGGRGAVVARPSVWVCCVCTRGGCIFRELGGVIGFGSSFYSQFSLVLDDIRLLLLRYTIPHPIYYHCYIRRGCVFLFHDDDGEGGRAGEKGEEGEEKGAGAGAGSESKVAADMKDDGDAPKEEQQEEQEEAERIAMWLSCALCGARTARRRVSDGAFLLSCAKFLELLVSSSAVGALGEAVCVHTAPLASASTSQTASTSSTSAPPADAEADAPLPRLHLIRHFACAPRKESKGEAHVVSFALSEVSDMYELLVPRETALVGSTLVGFRKALPRLPRVRPRCAAACRTRRNAREFARRSSSLLRFHHVVPTPPQPSSAMRTLDSIILPILGVAKAGASGIGVPGVEPAINGVWELATMLSTMKANKEDLLKLQESLRALIAINPLHDGGGDLKQRLTKLSSELSVIALKCTSLAEKGRLKRFFQSKKYKQGIQVIKDAVASHIQQFTFDTSISIEKIVQDIASNVRVIDRKTDTLNTRVQGLERRFDSGILASLKSVAARYNAANTPEPCMDGTRVNVIQDIVARLTGPPDSTRVMMLSGVAGSGKSAIAKSVAAILAEEKGILAGSFFFSRDYVERKEIKHLATTLAMQIADYNTIFRTNLIQFLETDCTGILEAGPHLQFQKLVVNILGNLPPSSRPWIICLDALDECGQDHGQVFLRWLSDSIAQIPAHIRFFLTGRPDVPAYLKFDTLHSLVHEILLITQWGQVDYTASLEDPE
ncbi:hypothetical protein FB451DRAFT_1394027 [Mycena latifolia]|nr:hypothetical protein FB451DRAFT_1394027 [Mycena latifolia]